MNLLSKITGLGRTDPFTTNKNPDIEPSNGPRLDAPVLILQLLTQLEYDTRQGYRHHDMLAQYTYIIQQRLEEHSIEVNGYTWSHLPREDQHDHFVHSEQFYADLYDGLPNTTKPAVRTSDDTTYGGDPLRFYSVNGHTDLYINEYYENTTADREEVEAIVTEFVSELPGPVSNNMTYILDECLPILD